MNKAAELILVPRAEESWGPASDECYRVLKEIHPEMELSSQGLDMLHSLLDNFESVVFRTPTALELQINSSPDKSPAQLIRHLSTKEEQKLQHHDERSLWLSE